MVMDEQKKRTYELKIGFCEYHNRKNGTRVHHEYISAPSLNAAKQFATKKMKELDEMCKYAGGRWETWCSPIEHKQGHFYVNKQTRPMTDQPTTIGFVQLAWDHIQMSLFDDISA